ncbi:MAG: hypothetical protein HQ541_19220 [Mariniphaga sp.]|nr:hypothetical protein [Mariniphaga sp.]
MLDYFETIKLLPPEYPENLLYKNRKEFLNQEFTIIVLDDDPTGTQTVFDVPVLTTWGKSEIHKELQVGERLFFILTNSRSLTPNEAEKLAMKIGRNIKAASEISGRKVLVISRGDSTLRGHYPIEVDALGKGLGIENSPQILIPALFQGGRYTINDIHFVREGDDLIPAAETPFAKDNTFGYTSSDLKEYIEEKTHGNIKAKDVVSISLDNLRIGGPVKINEILDTFKQGQACIVNAVSQSDLEVFASGFLKWFKNSKTILFRTAASVVPSLAGLPVKNPLQKNDLCFEGMGGIIAVGSYVPKTSLQLDFLKKNYKVEYIEINVANLLNPKGYKLEVSSATKKIDRNLKAGQSVVVYTSRKIIKGNSPEESLRIVNMVSEGMVEVFKNVKTQPRFFISKGGITSSDILTKSLEVKKAKVLGQIIPGVPIWKLGDESKFPKLLFMAFPGNLGGEDAVYEVVKKFN